MGQSQGQTIRNTIIFDSMNNDNDNDRNKVKKIGQRRKIRDEY
jgi:hypothetical protein